MPAFRLFPVLAETGISAGLCNSAGDSLRIYRENPVSLGDACGENELVCFLYCRCFQFILFLPVGRDGQWQQTVSEIWRAGAFSRHGRAGAWYLHPL